MTILVEVDNLAVQMDLQEDTAVQEVLVEVCQIQHQMDKVQVMHLLYHHLKVFLVDQLLAQTHLARTVVEVLVRVEINQVVVRE